MNGFWRRVGAGLVILAVGAGASGLIIAHGTAREVENLKKAEAKRQERELENSKLVTRIDANVQALKDQVNSTDKKLDQLLQRELERR